MRLALAAVVPVALAGCGIGVGSMSAANRPAFGQPLPTDEERFTGCGTEEVSRQWIAGNWWRRTMQTSCWDYTMTGFSRAARHFGGGGGVKRGWARSSFEGEAEDVSTSITELHATGFGHVSAGQLGLSLGATMVVVFESPAFLMGGGLRASVSPVPPLAIDASYTRVSGTYEHNGGFDDISGSRVSLGTTVMLYGRKFWRLSAAVAVTATDAGPYQSHGLTYELISTIW